MNRKKANAILKGSLAVMTVLLWEGSGICGGNLYPVWAADESVEYGKYGTFDMENARNGTQIGETIGTEADESINESTDGSVGENTNESNDNNTAENTDGAANGEAEDSETPSLGERFSSLGEGNGLNGLPGRIPSDADASGNPQDTQNGQTTQTETSSKAYKCTQITDPATGLNVARGYAPSDYTVSGETTWCGQWQSINTAAQVYLAAMSPDQNTIMGYYSPVSYEQILEYSQNGVDFSNHQDGAFDSETMVPMLQFMTADAYCDYMAKAILPGQQLQIAGQSEVSQEAQAKMDEKANQLYQMADQQLSQLNTGLAYNVDGTYYGVIQRTYSVNLNGYPFKLDVMSAVEGMQVTFSGEYAYNMGNVKNSFISWDSPFVFFMLTQEGEYDANQEMFEQFVMNTTISDQFADALGKVQSQLTQARLQQSNGSMEALTSDCQSSVSSSAGSDSSYMAEQFTDYIYSQNDYTLSNGDHVKVPTSYDYVYEGDDGNVYVSESSFDQPAGSTQLYPN